MRYILAQIVVHVSVTCGSFVTSDRHNLLISKDVCALVKLGVGPTGGRGRETALFQLAVTTGFVSPARSRKLETVNSAQNPQAVQI